MYRTGDMSQSVWGISYKNMPTGYTGISATFLLSGKK